MTDLATLNGHAQIEPLRQQRSWEDMDAAHSSSVDGLAAQMEEQLRNEEQAVALIEAALVGYRDRAKKLTKALTALKGEPLHPVPRQPPAPRAASADRNAKRKKTWVGEDKLETVLAVFAALGDGSYTVTEIAEHELVDFSDQTVRIALGVLRERELVRVARQEKRKRWFALMPEAQRAA